MLSELLVVDAFTIHERAIHFRFTSLRFMRSTGYSGGQVNNTPKSAALLWELGNNVRKICLRKMTLRCLLRKVTTWYVILDPARFFLFSVSVCIPCYLTTNNTAVDHAISLFHTTASKRLFKSNCSHIFVDSKQKCGK